ncbi:hypothetical protein E0485_02935 [Paenibacillus albiflavus]|uniref:Uncharacterized protein n=1 Tax=Paenibacillus albiflavus TaxID=2545760 RepID=A0A4R4ERR4_9BACL|nr:hypothetical protein [Paenibacillus albiflavus]TCZ81245.1 hypothetical protein E0485_02935 [Paenibacillus albiflavus]
MEKRLTRTDYLFAILTIFMLVCVLGAFFIGYNIGSSRADDRYQSVIESYNTKMSTPETYSSQALVSFYHNMYLPYNKFQKAWFETINDIKADPESKKTSAKIRSLASYAEKTLDNLQAKVNSISPSNPLLQSANTEYIASLQSFITGLENLDKHAKSVTSNQLISLIDTSTQIQEAKQHAVKAQSDYYNSMVKWGQFTDATVKSIGADQPLSIDEWTKLSLLSKNEYIAARHYADVKFTAYMPQDLTYRIDEFIQSGQNDKLNLKQVTDIIALITSMDAVKPADFIENKTKYTNQLLPDIPFFTMNN